MLHPDRHQPGSAGQSAEADHRLAVPCDPGYDQRLCWNMRMN